MATTESTRSDDHQTHIVLHEERDVYSVGESVSFKLQIQNHDTSPINIRNFVFNWDDLAFSSPNAPHLIAPDGQDLMLPYECPPSSMGEGASITVNAGSDGWQILPISSHLHLRETGEYVFWLDLVDNLGGRLRSNEIRFTLTDVEYSMPPQSVELLLESAEAPFAATQPIYLQARFTNRVDEPLTILKPQQDSFDGWVNPIYQFTVADMRGRQLALARRDGTMATPTYTYDSMLTLSPGESYRETLRLPVFPKMKNAGEYKVRLTYIVRENAVGKGGVVLDRRMGWPDGVFMGRLESNEVTIRIE